MKSDNSINESLGIIRKALEDDTSDNEKITSSKIRIIYNIVMY